MEGVDALIGGDKLILRGLTFYGFHGAIAEERTLGQKFVVDVDAWLDLNSFSYAEIYLIAKRVIEGPAQNLLESVAHKIAIATLEVQKKISAVRVKVGKPHVAIQGPVDYLGVEILRRRGDLTD
jgi:7,8-dihydroneopterin aldolase/epimerase/oxygenase